MTAGAGSNTRRVPQVVIPTKVGTHFATNECCVCVLRGMGLDHLAKTDKAIVDLAEKGMAPE
jgi:hypothetical protein